METRNNVAFSFYLRRTRLNKNGEAPIIVKITANGTKDEIAVLRNISPEKWSTEKNGAMGNARDARELNDYLNHFRNRLHEHYKLLLDKGQDITARNIKYSYLGLLNEDKMIVDLFLKHNKSIRLLASKGKDYAPATAQRYETCLKHLQNYIKEKYQKDDFPVGKINPDFIKGFELYLKTIRNCEHNTTMKYIKNFKKIVNNAFLNGWISQNPFANISLRLKKVDKGFLTDDELSLIINKKFAVERLEHVKDVFLFGCFTGLAYSDLKNLTPENLVIGEDGKLWIHTRRIKTDMMSHIPLLPVALDIVNKYKSIPYCIENNVLLPVYSNQKMNAYLKEIADICGINKYLSSHMARHTFATTVTLNNDVPIESVSKMLGHSTITMTQKYARLLDKKVSQDMSKLQEKFATGNILKQREECLN